VKHHYIYKAKTYITGQRMIIGIMISTKACLARIFWSLHERMKSGHSGTTGARSGNDVKCVRLA
jgi:hypothetical protein